MRIRIELQSDRGFSWGEIEADDALLQMMPRDARQSFLSSRIEKKIPSILEQYDEMNRMMKP